MKYKKTFWLDKDELTEVPTYEYWNDKKIESSKMWSIPNNDFGLFEKKFLSKGLFQQFKALTHDINFSGLTGASLASGNCILESFIINHNNQKINKLYCIEMSEHRIHHYAPKILDHYKISPNKVELCLGSFYDLKLDDHCLDFILLSQAYHHADDPKRLLKEIDRVLKNDGYLFIVGEHFYPTRIVSFRIFKHLIKYLINYNKFRKNNNLIPEWGNLFPPCIIKGDIHYSKKEYFDAFRSEKFFPKRKIFKDYGNQGFLLRKIIN